LLWIEPIPLWSGLIAHDLFGPKRFPFRQTMLLMRHTIPAKPDAAALLAWYDINRRELPWRAGQGEVPDPYRVWLSEIMLQQTTVAAAKPYFERFLGRFPTIEALAAAPAEAVMQLWAGLGYYARARNLHACAKVAVVRFGGRFPVDAATLGTLPGIGPYTAAAVAAIAFDAPVAAVDGNVERVVARLWAIEEPLPQARSAIRDLAATMVPGRRAGDFAQALMDLGATVCTPKRPDCGRCPWRGHCRARAEGAQESYPRKEAKRQGRLRRGAAFVAVRNGGAVLITTRPPKGLLGGMAEVPGTAWTATFDEAKALASAPVVADWRRIPGVVRHVFTHFPLELTVFVGHVPAAAAPPPECRWIGFEGLADEALPSLMRKVLAQARVPT
jgi:A/G-specific adenine glycosylase